MQRVKARPFIEGVDALGLSRNTFRAAFPTLVIPTLRLTKSTSCQTPISHPNSGDHRQNKQVRRAIVQSARPFKARVTETAWVQTLAPFQKRKMSSNYW
jgi:hypothetical protein